MLPNQRNHPYHTTQTTPCRNGVVSQQSAVDHHIAIEHLDRFAMDEHHGRHTFFRTTSGRQLATPVCLRHKKVAHRLDKFWDET